MRKVDLHPSWNKLLEKELEKPYFQILKQKITAEYLNKTIYPPEKLIFNAFSLTPLDKVKVVILGQDPYHGKGQAHGLSFSVQKEVKIPPSLMNIYKELKSDINKEIPKNGFLENWASQGVLLLNNILTVRSGKPNSHKNLGWEKFTESTIHLISKRKKNLVFLLWGNDAQKKEKYIHPNKHLVLKTVHPSPLSAYRGFFGSKHFSKSNNYLKKNNIKEIIW